MMSIALTTFGSRPSAIYLVRLLNENGSSKQLRKVSQFLVTHAIIARDIRAAKMSPIVKQLAIAEWQRQIQESKLQGINTRIMEVMKNVAMGKTKELL